MQACGFQEIQSSLSSHSRPSSPLLSLPYPIASRFWCLTSNANTVQRTVHFAGGLCHLPRHCVLPVLLSLLSLFLFAGRRAAGYGWAGWCVEFLAEMQAQLTPPGERQATPMSFGTFRTLCVDVLEAMRAHIQTSSPEYFRPVAQSAHSCGSA